MLTQLNIKSDYTPAKVRRSKSPQEDLRSKAEAILRDDILDMKPAGQGANSKLYCLRTASERYALKLYPERQNDTRDRLTVEWKALNFLRAAGLKNIPSAHAYDSQNRFMLMQWLEGQTVRYHVDQDLEQATDFLIKVFHLSQKTEAQDFTLASEACLSSTEIFRQIDKRLSMFDVSPDLELFFEAVFYPLYHKHKNAFQHLSANDQALDKKLQRLIPADFGFHNALKQTDGRLYFFDFDYFGWDDPVKLTADFILHPAMSISPKDAENIVSSLATALPWDPDFKKRLALHMPLYALRWALILLNPLRKDRISELPKDSTQKEKVIKNQIQKASEMCRRAESKI